MIQDFINMDTQEKIRYVSESSNASTSGYSTMSPGPSAVLSGNSPNSSVFSSPVQSPATALQTEFSNLNLPSANYIPLQDSVSQSYALLNYTNLENLSSVNMLPQHPQHLQQQPQQHIGLAMMHMNTPTISPGRMPQNSYVAELKIREEPMEKFRFRYKSEMHGTHGSLNGANSQRTPKTFPEVELCNFNGRAVIRCSLFQTNLDSPHSHQLVVRKDEMDACDPHDLHVSPESGFIAEFQNMGIIHTAKKFIFDELLKKKTNRLLFELGTNDLSTKQTQELRKQTEKEAKEMNLNQVRLCYEAFKIEENKSYTRIAAPIYTKFINNRKSAQTGELRICRLSIATGSVNGGEDIILLVEKVSKKNIKVRFYEIDDDDEVVWEDYAKFRESDVHHQYAITCQIPPYKDKKIEKPVEVCIELLRPSDDERSSPPVTFRYKPSETITSRKRKRTGNSSSGSSLSSFEVPKTVQEQTANLMPGITTAQYNPSMQPFTGHENQTISQEFNKEGELQKLLGDGELFSKFVVSNSEELKAICPQSILDLHSFDFKEFDEMNDLQTDGSSSPTNLSNSFSVKNKQTSNFYSTLLATNVQNNPYLQQIFKIFDEVRIATSKDKILKANWAKKIEKIFSEHAERNELGDTLLHEVIVNDNSKVTFKTCHILDHFELRNLFNITNMNNESPLHCACILNKPHYIRPMLALGCNPNIQDRNSNTALHIAVQENYDNCVGSFLNASGGNIRPDLRIRNDDGFTPLHLAVRQNNINIVQKLLILDKFAALEPNSKDGNNVLHMAILQQNNAMVKLIIKELNVNEIIVTRNAAGLTAIDMARNIDSTVGKDIFMYLSQICDDTNSPITIKEEDASSTSSTEEDEEETRSSISSVKIKHESNAEEYEDNADAEENVKLEEIDIETEQRERKAQILKNIIEDKRNYELLLQILNDSNNWKEMAHKAQIGHLTFLWRSAADMLNYVKTKNDSTLYQQLATALNQFNKKTKELFETNTPT